MKNTTETSALSLLANDAGYDPLEDRLRENIRSTIEAVFEEELGVIVGVTAGLILSGVQFAVDWWDERQQIGYINEAFSNSYARLCDDRDKGFEPYKLFIYYEIVLDTMELLVEHRADRLSYDKLYNLRILVEAAQIDKQNNYDEYIQSFTVEKAGDLFYFNPVGAISWLTPPIKC